MEGIDNRAPFVAGLQALFESALDKNPFGVVCSVIRVSGCSGPNWDPFEEMQQALSDMQVSVTHAEGEISKRAADRLLLLMYCQLLESTAPHDLLANLLRIDNGKEFLMDPFFHLIRRSKTNPLTRIMPSIGFRLNTIIQLGQEASRNEISDVLRGIWNEHVRNGVSHSDYVITSDELRVPDAKGVATSFVLDEIRTQIDRAFGFYGALLSLQVGWLRWLGAQKRYHKWPKYEVFEILTDENKILCGFALHFSNGTKASFSRTSGGVRAINVSPENDGSISFFVGMIDELAKVWKIDGVPVSDWSALP